MNYKTLSFPKLDLLTPTLESTCLKLMEESGELAQLIGRYRRMSGEPFQGFAENYELLRSITSELLDVAQVAVTMMYVLEDRYNMNIDLSMIDHVNKLIMKGYATPPKEGQHESK